SVQTPDELLDASLEHGPLRLGVGGELLEAATELCLELADARIERVEPRFPLLLEHRGRVREPAFEPLRAGVADVGEPLREDRLRFACEDLDGPVELARQSTRRVLPAGADDIRERLCTFVRVRRRRTLDDTLELLDLAALHVLEAGANPLRRFALLALDALDQLALALAQALVELVQRAPALGRVCFDFRLRSRHHFFERFVDIRAHALERGAKLVALRREAVGIGGHAQLGVRKALLLPLSELEDVRARRVGDAIEILRPAGEPLLDLRLRRRQSARQRRTGLALALGELAAVLLGELPLLLDEERHRIGAGARQGALELRCTVLRLLLDERAQALLGFVQVN